MRRGIRTALYEYLLCTFRVVFVLFVALSRRRVLFLYFSFLHLRYYVSFHTPYIFLLGPRLYRGSAFFISIFHYPYIHMYDLYVRVCMYKGHMRMRQTIAA